MEGRKYDQRFPLSLPLLSLSLTRASGRAEPFLPLTGNCCSLLPFSAAPPFLSLFSPFSYSPEWIKIGKKNTG